MIDFAIAPPAQNRRTTAPRIGASVRLIQSPPPYLQGVQRLTGVVVDLEIGSYCNNCWVQYEGRNFPLKVLDIYLLPARKESAPHA